MLPPRLAVPLMIKLDVPAVLLIVPSKSRVAAVSAACKSRVALGAITRSVALLRLPVSLRVPALIVVLPV